MASGRKQSNIASHHQTMGANALNQNPVQMLDPVAAISGPLPMMDVKPFTQGIPPEVKQNAFFKDRYEGRINAIDELEKGNRLSERGLKQLNHAFDLAEYSRINPKTPQDKVLLNESQNMLQNALAQNDFLHVLRESGQDPESPV